ncbi:MAG: NGG1p interacting factor NIF3 [Candidatus Omnitrophica bacterium]|nr:NGG1p interacting factor NIF3 [Candidatus Omnitrophota bacterium]
MKLKDFYSNVVAFGIERDPREDRAAIVSFADTALLHGDPEKEIRKILVGIDIDVADLLLADRIRSTRGLDLVISHHPQGRAYAGLSEVMRLQADLLASAGVPRKTATGMLEERMREVERKIHPANHMRVVDAAALLDLAFMCVHTPADNHVAAFIDSLVRQHKPRDLQTVVEVLNAVPEYQEASAGLAGPRIILGNPRRPCGRIFVEMTGGTEGPRDAYESLHKAGIRTIVSMHLGEEHFKKVRDANLNVVIAGHIASDTLGLNLLLDRIERIQKMSVTSCSGFRRVRRMQ